MGALWIAAYRWVIAGAAWIVPPARRDAWLEDWAGDFWRWLLDAAATGDAQARKVLRKHIWDAVRTALAERRAPVMQHPLTPVVAGVVLLCTVALFTNFFSGTRRLLAGLPYRDADRLVLLAQGPPTLGIRLGFLESDVKVMRTKASTLESLATYGWFPAKVNAKEALAAAVGPEFFDVLGKGPSLGQWVPTEPTFLASQDFFERQLKGDPTAIGREFVVNGVSLKLTGVLPRNFSFLGLPISVWVPPAAHTVPGADKKWWLSLRGAVARVKPGVQPSASEIELREILVRAGLGRKNSKVYATPLRTTVNRPLWGYGGLLAMVLLGWTVWTLCAAYRSGEPWRFWAYFLGKSVPLILAIFLFVFEILTSRAGAASGVWWGGELFALWILFCGIALFAAWAWRDQKRRCRVCLTSLREPLRIGTSGQMLLDPSGEEITCPFGHGSLYSSQSLIGRELADRWLDLKSLT